MISTNPLLGPQWEPIAHVLIRLLEDVRRGKLFSVQTYIRRCGLSPYDSPYLQAVFDDESGVQMELSGNLQVNPPLTEDEYQQLEFYGWKRPEVTPEEYQEGGGSGNPNFVRFYAATDDPVDIAEFLLTSLVGVFGMTEQDFWGVNSRSEADRIDKLRKLGRLLHSDGNPDRLIFALPGIHDDMCSPIPGGTSAQDAGR